MKNDISRPQIQIEIQNRRREREENIPLDEYRNRIVHAAVERNLGSILGVQPSPRDPMNKEIFAMLDDIRIANKENSLSKSSNMAAMT